MIKRLISKNPLYFAFLFPAIMDEVTTLLGQDPQYWSSSRTVIEASPAYYFLSVSPWLFLLGSIVWFIFWYWLFKKIKEPLNLFLMFLFIAGHSWGSSSWIMKIFKQNGVYALNNQPSIIFAWSLLIIYFVLIASIATYCIRLYMGVNKKR